MQVVFSNLKVSGSMNFEALSFEAFRQLMDYIDTLTGETSEPEATDAPAPEVKDEPIVPAGMDFPGGMPVHVYEKPEDMEPAKPTEVDPYAKVGNYGGKSVVVGILKDAAEHPDKWEREWLTTRKWMDEKVCLPPEATLFNVAHICSDCARLGLLERRADHNVEEHKNEVRFLLPVPISVKKDTIGRRIHKARKENGFLVTELADLLGYSDTLLAKWETDELIPSTEAVENLKKALGDDLFEGLEVK